MQQVCSDLSLSITKDHLISESKQSRGLNVKTEMALLSMCERVFASGVGATAFRALFSDCVLIVQARERQKNWH